MQLENPPSTVLRAMLHPKRKERTKQQTRNVLSLFCEVFAIAKLKLLRSEVSPSGEVIGEVDVVGATFGRQSSQVKG